MWQLCSYVVLGKLVLLRALNVGAEGVGEQLFNRDVFDINKCEITKTKLKSNDQTKRAAAAVTTDYWLHNAGLSTFYKRKLAR